MCLVKKLREYCKQGEHNSLMIRTRFLLHDLQPSFMLCESPYTLTSQGAEAFISG